MLTLVMSNGRDRMSHPPPPTAAGAGETASGLRPEQRQAIEVLLRAESPRAAAAELGISYAVLAQWLADDAFRKAYVELRREAVLKQIELLEGGGLSGSPAAAGARGEAASSEPEYLPIEDTPGAQGGARSDATIALGQTGPSAALDEENQRKRLALFDLSPANEPILPERLGPPLSYTRALRMLAEANSSYEVGSVVLAFARKHWERVVLLAKRRDALCGWLGQGEGIVQSVVAALSIPLDVPSAFRRACIEGMVHSGKLPAGEIETRFLSGLGRPGLPIASLVFPITVAGKTATVLYCDVGSSAAPPGDVSELYQLGFEFSVAFERIIRLRKSGNDRGSS